MGPGKKLIIYDLDGTLADTRRDIADSANHMLREMGREPLAQKEIEGYVGKGLTQLIQGCLKTENPKKIEKGAKLYRRYYGEHMLDHTVLYPKIKEILDYFKSRSQAVLTNKPEPFTTQILSELGIKHYFFKIVAGNSGYPKKPDPASLHDLMKSAAAGPQESLFIGDSAVDIETSRNAGIEIAVVSHGFEDEKSLRAAGPDWLGTDIEALIQYAKESGW